MFGRDGRHRTAPATLTARPYLAYCLPTLKRLAALIAPDRYAASSQPCGSSTDKV